MSDSSSTEPEYDGVPYRPAMTIDAYGGHRVLLMTCRCCGALVVEDEALMKGHAAWHVDLNERIAANRPDPRSAFIGG